MNTHPHLKTAGRLLLLLALMRGLLLALDLVAGDGDGWIGSALLQSFVVPVSILLLTSILVYALPRTVWAELQAIAAEVRSRPGEAWLATGIFAMALGIMAANSVRHPIEDSYDYPPHRETLEKNLPIREWCPVKGVAQFEYNPPLYYYAYGKAVRIFQLVSGVEIDAFLLLRFLQLGGIALAAGLFVFGTGFQAGRPRGYAVFLVLALFLLPNLYLSQVMARADHMLSLALNLLFFAWFRYDYIHTLGSRRSHVIFWAVCLILMANSRHVAFGPFLLFLVAGLYAQWRRAGRGPGRGAAWRRLAVQTALILALGGQHYILRFIRTGRIVSQSLVSEYYIRYDAREKGFDRAPMFANLQFNLLLEKPNRRAVFRNGNNAVFPRLYGDAWADHWLYFSGPKSMDRKEACKRIVLVVAAPWSLLCLFSTLQGLAQIRRQPFSRNAFASLVFLSGFAAVLAFIYTEPEVGKNSTVKFSYLLAFQWLPVLTLADWLSTKPRLLRGVCAYIALVFLLCIPLYWY